MVKESQLPIDTNVSIPAAIKNAAALAESAYKAAYGDNPPEQTPSGEPAPAAAETPRQAEATGQPQLIQLEPASPPSSPPSPQLQPQPQAFAPAPPVQNSVPTPSKEELNEDNWAARYNSMKGRWEQSQQTIGSMQEQMVQLGDELQRVQRLLQQRNQPPPPKPQPLITDKDVEAYGPELIDTIKRAAREAVQPDLLQIQQTTQQVRQRVVAETQRGVYDRLGTEIPNWREINDSQRFKAWAGLRDVYSGEVRSKLLNAALQAADAPRVIAFFRGFLNEEAATGHSASPQPETPVASRQAAIPLVTLAAPGKAKPASGTMPNAPADKPIFTRAQIAAFYSQAGRTAYIGRDADRAQDEAAIFAAQREGRVR